MAAITEAVNRAAMGQGVPNVTAMDSAGGTGGSSTEAATISANDFLTLLVTEMKNQDPTANTDPNEYINQLVNVNSLEQLISINQTLSTGLGTSAASDVGATSNAVGSGAGNIVASPVAKKAEPSPSGVAMGVSALQGAASHAVTGNLGIPAANASAQRVADSLNGAEHQISRARNPF